MDLEKSLQKFQADISSWKQGDCFLTEKEFPYTFNPNFTKLYTGDPVEGNASTGIVDVEGLVIVSQTCDVIRDVVKRPYLEVAALVKLNKGDFKGVKAGKVSRHLYVPQLEAQQIVANIEMIATVEKLYLMGKDRISGFNTEKEARGFAYALGKKRARFPFPDDFVAVMEPMTSHLKDKELEAVEAKAVERVMEIRVKADPTWEGSKIDVELLFITEVTNQEIIDEIEKYVDERWLPLVRDNGKYVFNYQVKSYDGISAMEYRSSEEYETDHVSGVARR